MGILKPSTTFFKSSPLGHLITFGKSTSAIAWQTLFTIWQAVLFPIPNLQPRERRSSPVARCQKQMAKRFLTVMDFLNLVSFLFSVSFNLLQIKRKDSLESQKFSSQSVSSFHWLTVSSQNWVFPLLGSIQKCLSRA